MNISTTVAEFKTLRKTWQGASVGFVPTMGALHAGHRSLIERSLREQDKTVVSIFINPTQFNVASDFSNYPKTWDADIALLEQAGVDAVFAPTYTEMYPDDYTYVVHEKKLSTILCGSSRPGHFDGVCTIVLKLFNIIQPDTAYFGEKDYQQYLIIDNMVKAFHLPLTIVPCPLVREADGLALSSRNQRLSSAAREKAPRFYACLSSGGSTDEVKHMLEAEGFQVDYVEDHFGRRFGAVFLEDVRLIDNVKL